MGDVAAAEWKISSQLNGRGLHGQMEDIAAAEWRTLQLGLIVAK